MTEPNYSTNLSISTLAKLHLSKQPFNQPEKSEDLFRNISLEMLLNSLLQQLEHDKYTHAIKGERGSGKSCLCKLIIHNAPANFRIFTFDTNAQTSINDIFYDIASGADDALPQDSQDLAARAADKIFELLKNRTQPVLLIDNAHLLPDKPLRRLVKFSKAVTDQGYGNLKLVFVGEREIEPRLNEINTQLPYDINLHINLLRPFNPEDTSEYIRFRLKRANSNQTMPLNKVQLEQIQKNCGGLPGKIDRLSAEALNNGISKGSLNIGNIKKPVTIAAAMCVLAALAYLLYRGVEPNTEAMEVVELPIKEAIPPEPGLAYQENNTDQEPEPFVYPEDPIFDETADLNAEASEELFSEEPDNDADTAFDDVATNDTEPEPAIAANTVTTQSTRTANQVIDTQVSPLWLAEQSADSYMIQLAAAWSLPNLSEFSRSLQLQETLVFLRTQRNEQDWHILLYGPFDSPAAAKQAISALPAGLQENQPWVRRISSIQKTISNQ